MRENLEETLFWKSDWSSVEKSIKQKMSKDIAAQDGNQLLNTSTDDLAAYYEKKYKIDVPIIDHDNVSVGQREAQIDVRNDHIRYPFASYVTGTAIDVEVPFQGDENAFHVQPTTHTTSFPRAEVSSGVLRFTLQGINMKEEQVQAEIKNRLEKIETYLSLLNSDVSSFNNTLIEQVKNQIETRKKKLLSDRNLVAGLGFKIRPKGGDAATYLSPNVRRKIAPKIPAASADSYKPEPVLETSEYEHILSVLENMASVMEQSPKAFNQMGEEALRTHFLVQLNGQYEGNATGETFNFEGKTDILIKAHGKNIFIGECKFWSGEKAFIEAIDQLLGYVSWRDTKTAVLVFNRNKNFSEVLDTIAICTTKHPNCKKLIKQMSDTSWSYLFSQRGDSNREMIVTIQAYDIPTEC